jgi:hypothetical protein
VRAPAPRFRSCCLAALVAGSSATQAAKPDDPAVRFRFDEQAAARGITAVNHCGSPTKKRYVLEELGQGCALFDKDGDGDLDAYLVDASSLVAPTDPEGAWKPALDGRCRMYENDGGGRFADVTDASGAGLAVFGQGVVAADYDGDADLDLYVTCWGGNHLLQNDGKGRFRDVTEQAGVVVGLWSVGAAFFDADGDGDLDLYVGNYFSMDRARDPDCWRKVDCPYYELLAPCGPKGMVPEADTFFRNKGDGTFEDASEESGFRSAQPSYALGLVAFDYDLDGDLDLFVANDSRAQYLFENDGRGRFTEVAQLAGCALSASGMQQAGMGVACGDADGDLDLDLFLTTFSHDDKTLFLNDGAGSFLDGTRRQQLGTETWLALGWGTEFVDLDLDGDLDLFVSNGHVHVDADRRAPELTYRQRCRTYLNEEARFRDVTLAAGKGFGRLASYRGAAFGDVDGDGDDDVLVATQNEAPALFVNEQLGPRRHWLVVELDQPGPNRFAVGARAVAEVGGRKLLRFVHTSGSFASASDTRLRFGLGDAAVVDELTVWWPDGTTQKASGVAGDRVLRWTKGGAPAPRLP